MVRESGRDFGRALEIGRPGRIDYATALAWQESLAEGVLAGAGDVLLLLEHAPVYTLGRGADARFLGAATDGGIEIVRVGRGGQVTYHGPGQLVGYPILDLGRHRRDVGWYVRALEAVLVRALETLGVRGERRVGSPGVWVGARKIGSIGVQIRRWVTWHGFALNVGDDLRAFDAITPCGLEGVQMTSVSREGGTSDVEVAADAVLDAFVHVLGYESWHAMGATGAGAARSA